MKLFWSIIIVFALAAIFVAWGQFSDGASVDSVARVEQPPTPAESASANGSRGETRVIEAETQPVEETAEQDGGAEADASAEELVDDLLGQADTPWPVDSTEATDAPLTGSPSGDHEGHNPQPADLPSNPPNPWEVEAENREPLEHSIVEQGDGSMLIDDTFVLRGSGTKNDPYEISWDLLLSAAETYQPRLGMEDIPERIEMLDGAHVKIAGYLMFPMATAAADELLVMLNMWDGCCLGTMPSPYDAIEVRLSTPPPAGNQQFFNYGSLEGRLVVDPYLINDWLIGLYMMEDATLKVGM